MKKIINMKKTISTVKNILALFLTMSYVNSSSQNISTKSNYRLGLGVGTHLSGNSHGTMYNASVSLYNGKNYFSIGPCFQKCTKEICGAGFRYMRMLTGQESFNSEKAETVIEDKRFQLFVFAYAQYLKEAKLSKSAARIEESYAKQKSDVNVDYSNFQLSTTEIFTGFGINTKISQKLVWSTSIGFGTYYHINYNNNLYTERISPVLMLGTALRFNYIRR